MSSLNTKSNIESTSDDDVLIGTHKDMKQCATQCTNTNRCKGQETMHDQHIVENVVENVVENSVYHAQDTIIEHQDMQFAKSHDMISEKDSVIREKDSIIREKDSVIREMDKRFNELLVVHLKMMAEYIQILKHNTSLKRPIEDNQQHAPSKMYHACMYDE